MAKVLGVGGIFFKCSDPRRLSEWYSRCLGMRLLSPCATSFKPETMPKNGSTAWGPLSSIYPLLCALQEILHV